MRILSHRSRASLLALYFAASLSFMSRPVFASDVSDISDVMMRIWDKLDVRLVLGPVVVTDGYAIAGWSQSDLGGRALLRKKAGVWDVILCAGDDLKKAELLMKSGMTEAAARKLAAELSTAEAALPAERLALFSKFEGQVGIDPATGHAPHGNSSTTHKH